MMINIDLTNPEVLFNLFMTAMGIITLIAAICVTADSQGDKSNGWGWKCALWIIIALLKIWG